MAGTLCFVFFKKIYLLQYGSAHILTVIKKLILLEGEKRHI